MRPTKILVTGSAGHAGRVLIAWLQAEGYAVTGLDRVAGPGTTYTGDLLDRALVARALEGVEAVIHTASLHAPHVPHLSREAFIDTNIKGTLYLLEGCRQQGVKKLVYTSTTSLYGERLEDPEAAVWVTEDLPPIPRDIYDITKIAAEALCRDFFSPGQLQTLVLRVSRFWDEPWADKLFYRMYRGVDVRDVAYAHALALEADFPQFEIFNISAQTIFTPADLRDLRQRPREVLARKIPALLTYYAQHGLEMPLPIDRVYVIDKARRELGYAPRYNIDALLEGA